MSVVFALMRKSENGGDAAANTEKSENTNELDASALFVGENGQGSNEGDKVSEDKQQGDQGDSSSSNARSTREDSTDRTESGVNNGYCKQDMFDQMYVGEDVKKEAEKRAKVERAEAKKEVGNGFYGSRQYHKAAEYYAEAAKLVPTNMTYLNNLAATHLELKNYQKCVEVCQRAIDVGRENKATFKEIAKAYFRMGLAKDSMGSYKEAAAYYSKSLVEYRSTACEERLEQVEKKIKASDAFAKLDESNHILDQGLELKNNENYLAAIDCFTQSIALDPENHEAYYFRAMCRQAIDQFDAALEDIEAAISISAEQPRYYYIKASILYALKRPAECLKMCDVATQLATDVKHSHSLLTDIEKLRVCCSS
ncbi:Stress-induced-phosphoprotein 1 [Zancudomyces culisetae]|uniref:Stress-induced-phosphoprotein 1 n=1 Tax=Zancudomyces culisetae TaxID=1213189 RepID=A0A1R1PLD8_ZANCU|nr:Stress-induced-phosphoprotein 1 [Zancudomyces culisetae]|eukprot:OMH81788.1 Stress-induced-phosphoprotein 1 [Zancudomyces culisetae]